MKNEKVSAQEFEDFVYMVAHDMSSAQRHVREFTKLLLASFDIPLNEEQKAYKSYIEKGLERMEKMQMALLHYSRITWQDEHIATFSSDDCLKSALVHLGEKIGATRAEIHIPPHGYNIKGNPQQIEEVLTILMDNAITYVGENTKPVIDVTVRRSGERIKFSVCDNGISIRPEFFEQIYIMFRRLHPVDSYGGGIGAGLAIARKIVRLHGGESNARPAKMEGCAFLSIYPLAGINV